MEGGTCEEEEDLFRGGSRVMRDKMGEERGVLSSEVGSRFCLVFVVLSLEEDVNLSFANLGEGGSVKDALGEEWDRVLLGES